MSGRLASRIGVYDNAAEFPASVPTMAHGLRALGYAHLPRRQDAFRRPRPAARVRGAPDDRHLSRGFRLDAQLGRPGGADRLVVPQHGVGQAGRDRRGHQPARLRRGGGVPGASGWLADHVREPDGRPFFLCASFTHPHDPYADAARPTGSATVADEIDLPAVPALPRDAMDAHSLRLTRVCDMPAAAITEADVRRARHAYYGEIAYVDDRIGQLLAALERFGLRRRHRGPGHRRSRRNAGRARPVVQDALLRMGAARAADRLSAPGRFAAAPGAPAGLAGRRAADPARACRRSGRSGDARGRAQPRAAGRRAARAEPRPCSPNTPPKGRWLRS